MTILQQTPAKEIQMGEETSNQMIEHKLQADKTNVNRNNKTPKQFTEQVLQSMHLLLLLVL